jgi:hypothetical protein
LAVQPKEEKKGTGGNENYIGSTEGLAFSFPKSFNSL